MCLHKYKHMHRKAQTHMETLEYPKRRKQSETHTDAHASLSLKYNKTVFIDKVIVKASCLQENVPVF